jgi:hypothetical protein
MSDFLQAARYTARDKPEPHQVAAWNYAWGLLSADEKAQFLEMFRAAPAAKEPLSWAVIANMAKQAGAKYPDLVAAQWAQESGWGKYTSGKNNYFGIKGKPGTDKKTHEYVNGARTEIIATFKDYATPQDCVNDLVRLWYKDYKDYKGVNNAADRNAAARMLQAEGYATDPKYAERLIALMDKHAPAPAPQPPPAKVRPDSPFSTRLTPHITLGEFALGQEARRFQHQYQVDTAAELAAFLERCRAVFGGKPVVITSGYRPAKINAAVGGDPNSEHLYKKPRWGAVDFHIPGADMVAVQEWVLKNWPESVGKGWPRRGFIHLGIGWREERGFRVWDY